MQALANMCVRRPVTATVIILILSVVGFFGYTKLGVDRFPKVDFPIVTITTVQPGSSPEEIETEIVDKIEETDGQLLFEWTRLQEKLEKRSPILHRNLSNIIQPEPHPLFHIVSGRIRDWEKR